MKRPRIDASEADTVASLILEAPAAPPTLLDVVDQLLSSGVIADGDVMLGLAGVDLIYLRLSALLCAADRVVPRDRVRSRDRAGLATREPPAPSRTRRRRPVVKTRR